VSEIPDRPEGALLITNSSQTESVVRDAAEARIRRLWIQQGCQSAGALELARQKGLSVVSGECILMFAEPVGSFHRFHRWVWKLLGKLPK
jgi:predicted CoA-binding protein